MGLVALVDVIWWLGLGAAVLWVVAMAFVIYCLYGPGVGPPPASAKGVTGSRVIAPLVLLSALIGT